MRKKISHYLAITATIVLSFSCSYACTRILWNDNSLGVYSGRTMDWSDNTTPKYIVFPKGIERDGAYFNGEKVVEGESIAWRSKYGSMVISLYDMGAIDGLNEKGLSASLLYLAGSDFGERDPKVPGLQAGMWLQYMIDNAASVEEAVKMHENIQLVVVGEFGHKTNFHLALQDKSGDSAIFEYMDGELQIYHGKEYRVMTNAPAYPLHLANLETYDFNNPSYQTPLPGNVGPKDRFIRGSYLLSHLPNPKNDNDAVMSLLSVLRNVSVPINAPYTETTYNTEYRSITNISDLIYSFEWVMKPGFYQANLKEFNLDEGAPVMRFDLDTDQHYGDVTPYFTTIEKAPF